MRNSLVEEGIAVCTYATPELMSYQKPVRCGLITTITGDEFRDHRHNWKKKGFLSRTIPFSYSYGIRTVKRVFESILNLGYMMEHEIKLTILKADKEIKLSKKLAELILPSTETIAEAQDTYGFRLQKQFQVLLQASTLDHKRRSVNRSNVDRVQTLLYHNSSILSVLG